MSDKKIEFGLAGIQTEEFAIITENYSENETLKLNTSIVFKLDIKQKLLVVYTSFTFEQNEKIFLKLSVANSFVVKEDSWNGFVKDDKIVFPKNFAQHTSMITVGTARGVLHEKTNRTPFNKFILPTIDVTKLVKKEVPFSLL